eukprot:TRINITY_DN197_c0_g1_i6.p1 TRINITY_DN197_c0_g1~~TRINITY_DN197_c0_g1_i6.p1  ORF type:complete len:141 (+),score=19.28 TRINITY_DN197_c0_g1_i6:198-620(+)
MATKRNTVYEGLFLLCHKSFYCVHQYYKLYRKNHALIFDLIFFYKQRYVPKFCHLHDGFLDMYEVDPESRDDPKEKLWNRKVNLKTDVMFVGPAPSKKKVHTLELRTYRRTYFLQASSHVEMEEWVDLFRGSILALHSRN